MYRPPAFREDRLEVLHALIRAHPLGTLVTAGPDGLVANHIPFSIEKNGLIEDGGAFGVLRAHLARANGQVEQLRAGGEALVIFQGPQAYISPSWYASKAETHRVVPTWNYLAVHGWGTPRVIDDAAWLRAQIGGLTRSQEQDQAEPWAVEDAPDDFIAAQVKGIVGLEIPIARIEGKWKTSQNRSDADRAGVAAGLGEHAMADLVRPGWTPNGGAGMSEEQRIEKRRMDGVAVEDCSMVKASFDNVNLVDATFSNVNLGGARLTNVNLSGVTVEDANIQGLTIFGIDVHALIQAELKKPKGR